MFLLISERLEPIRKMKTNEEKVEALRRIPALGHGVKSVLKYAYDPVIELDFKRLPDFKPDRAPAGQNPDSLYNQVKYFYVLDKRTKIDLKRKENVLLNILESIHPDDAALVGEMLTRKIKNIPKGVVEKAWPDIFMDEDHYAIERGRFPHREHPFPHTG